MLQKIVLQLCLFYMLLYVIFAEQSTNKLGSCPNRCKCFSVDTEVLEVLEYRKEVRKRVNITTCQRQWLNNVPSDISPWTTDLYLAYNELTTLNGSSFRNLFELQALVLANNKLISFSNDTFLLLLKLTYLDLSNNFLTAFPDGSLCPWTPQFHDLPCPSIKDDHNKMLFLMLKGNKWRCTCYMQNFILNHTCNKFREFSCIEFIPISKSTSNIGYCSSPGNLVHVPLNRLSKEILDHAPPGRVRTVVNTCVMREAKIDIILLIVIFAWMGGTIMYVLHFVRWNNKEIARHKSYISSLESCNNMEQKSVKNIPATAVPETTTASPTSPEKHQKELTSLQRKWQGSLSEKDQLLEGQKAHLRHGSLSMMLETNEDSPVWKPRNISHKYRWDRPTSA